MINVNRHQLPNGLKLIHWEDKTTQMVALNILYDVGARDEDPRRTGFAHLMEHLMFGGSMNIPDYDTPVQQAGGENNAWTNNDVTNYYVTVPKQNAETAFWLESDRMLSLNFNSKSLEVQRQVVIEEFKQRYLNQPYGDSAHLLRRMAYTKHPYQWPTIGKELNHIADATLDEVKSFFFHHYAPNNSILVVTGDISFDEAIRLTNKWFANIPSREILERKTPVEPAQTEERRMVVERNVPVEALYMAFQMCGRVHPDYYVFDLISDVLCNGRSCRLIERLVNQKHIFNHIDAYITGSLDTGLLIIIGKPAPGVSLADAEAAVWDELNELKTALVDQEELEKVKNRFESEQIFGNMNYLNVATNLAFHELIGKAEDINLEVDKYRSVTPEQVQQVAIDYLVKTNCSVCWYIPQNTLSSVTVHATQDEVYPEIGE